MKVRKAVITAAGWGTRLLPLTKALPKELLPLVDKPLIQYSVEEAVSSGIEQIVIIISPNKHEIEHYFNRSPELERLLEQKGNTNLLNKMRKLSSLADIHYTEQKKQLGLGHAVLTAKELIGEEPFALLLPDDIITSKTPVLKQMIDVYEQYQASVIAVERILRQNSVKYGIIDPERISDQIYQVRGLIEKPEPTQAPSDLGVVGKYVLTSKIFDKLEITPPGKNGEIQLTDALQLLLQQQAIYAYHFKGTRHDTGNLIGWLKATLAFTLEDPDIGPEIRKYLQEIL